MFEKAKSDKTKPLSNNSAPGANFSAGKTTTKVTTIGASIKIRGEIAGAEDLIIQGNIEGTINLKNNNLTIGEKGDIKATTFAQRVNVKGTVNGDIMASEKITIAQTGKVNGNLTAPRVILEDGSQFKGSIDMSSNINTPSKEVRSSTPAAATAKPAAKPIPKAAASH
ncbi:MAG: polymer-forming cytoskeletal protein [Gammaproteobacteria bacterium]|nr:MAG: polymer-forming cytoskeletal protein [Gammaproteobacteria bacterium]